MAKSAGAQEIWCNCGAFAPYFFDFPLARCIALHKNRYSIEYGATVARLRRIFLDFSLAPLVEDGSPGDVQKCEIYARHAQFTSPLALHVVVPRAWEREFSLSSPTYSFSDTGN